MWGSALAALGPPPELASHLSVWAGLGWAGYWLGWAGLGWVTRKLKQEILWEESWCGYHQQIFRSPAVTEEEAPCRRL